MIVLLETDRAGMGFIQRAGEEVDLPREEALALVKSGQASLVHRTAIEVQTIAAGENASTRHSRPKFRR